jgi:hypothetical protein
MSKYFYALQEDKNINTYVSFSSLFLIDSFFPLQRTGIFAS